LVICYFLLEEFARYREAALETGFKSVASGPLVRSSYYAEELFPKEKQR
jgi:lipoyl synthase